MSEYINRCTVCGYSGKEAAMVRKVKLADSTDVVEQEGIVTLDDDGFYDLSQMPDNDKIVDKGEAYLLCPICSSDSLLSSCCCPQCSTSYDGEELHDAKSIIENGECTRCAGFCQYCERKVLIRPFEDLWIVTMYSTDDFKEPEHVEICQSRADVIDYLDHLESVFKNITIDKTVLSLNYSADLKECENSTSTVYLTKNLEEKLIKYIKRVQELEEFMMLYNDGDIFNLLFNHSDEPLN